MPGLPGHHRRVEQDEVAEGEGGEDPGDSRRGWPIPAPSGQGRRRASAEENGEHQREGRRREEESAVVEGGERPEAVTHIREDAAPGVLDGAGVAGEAAGVEGVADEPEGCRRRRDRRVEAGLPEPPGERHAAPPQQQQRHRRDEGDAEIAGQPGQGAPDGRPDEGGPVARFPALPAVEEAVRPEERQRREQQEPRLGHRLPGDLQQRQRGGEDQGRPAGGEPGGEPPFQVPAADEDRRAEEERVQRPDDRERVEEPQAGGGRQQQRPEGRPEGRDGAVEVGEPLPRQQAPGDREVVDPVRAERDSPARFAGEHQGGPQRRGAEGEEDAPPGPRAPFARGCGVSRGDSFGHRIGSRRANRSGRPGSRFGRRAQRGSPAAGSSGKTSTVQRSPRPATHWPVRRRAIS